jgi:invasion protein IalB
VDLTLRRFSSLRAAFAPWLLAGLLSLHAPAPALAQASQAPSGQAPSGQAPQSAAPQPQTGAPPPGKHDGQQFQNWTLHCKQAEGNSEYCEMHQRVVNKKGERVLLAVVGRVKDFNDPGMLILLPLGIALPPGVFLQIDNGQRQPLEIKLCERQGCRIEMLLKPELLAQLKAGTKATITFYIYDQQGKQPQIDVPVSLLGFSAALAEVQKPSS